MRSRTIRTLLAMSACVAVAAGARAQSGSAAAVDPVVAEIRAMKAELIDRLDASIRTQLIVARLQIQEQRATMVGRQLEDLAEQLRQNAQARAGIEAQLKAYGEPVVPVDPAKTKALFLAPLYDGLEQLDRTDAELKQQRDAVMTNMADEQARWSALYRQLDELERRYAPAGR